MNLKSLITFFIIGLSPFLSGKAAENNEVQFTYNLDSQQPFGYGLSRCDSYDICIHLDDSGLVGGLLKSMSVPIPVKSGCKISPEAKVWIATALPAGELSSENCIYLQDVSTTGKEVSTLFPDGISIPGGGLYVGYSVNVEENSGGLRQYPISVVDGTVPGSLYYRTSQSPKWDETFSRLDYMSAMKVNVEKSLPKVSISPIIPSDLKFKAGEESSLDIKLKNRGLEGVNSVNYYLIIDGKKSPGTIENIDFKNNIYGAEFPVSIPFDAPENFGDASLTLDIIEVNGIGNEGYPSSMTTDIRLLPVIPKYRPLVEEYTGLWCGSCPSGWVALEESIEKYGDDFVYITYHINDLLTPSMALPSRPNSVPAVAINREGMGYVNDIYDVLPELIESAPEVDLDMDLNVKLGWNDEAKSELKASAVTTFMKNINNADYEVELILVADNLSDPKWGQTNNYAGQYGKGSKFWDIFTNGSSIVYGLNYNSVATMRVTKNNLEGSIPKQIKEFETYPVSTVFQLDKGVSGNGVLLTANKNNLRVIAILIDKKSGTLINSASSILAADIVNDDTEGISGIYEDNFVIKEFFYDLRGIKLSVPPVGVPYIKVNLNSDGSISTERLISTNS